MLSTRSPSSARSGVLTSDSTRIHGLVSLADVATGRVRVEPDADPGATLRTLERRIERNDRWRLPLVDPRRRARVSRRARPAAVRAAGVPPRARREPLARRLVGRRPRRRGRDRAAARASPARRCSPPICSRSGSTRVGRPVAVRPVAGGALLRRLEPARDVPARPGARRRRSRRAGASGSPSRRSRS